MLLLSINLCLSLCSQVFDFDWVWILLQSLQSVLETLVVFLNEVATSDQDKPNLLVVFYFQRVETIFFAPAEVVPKQIEFRATHVQVKKNLCVCWFLLNTLIKTVKRLLTVFFREFGRFQQNTTQLLQSMIQEIFSNLIRLSLERERLECLKLWSL